jgi:hypothetical protein
MVRKILKNCVIIILMLFMEVIIYILLEQDQLTVLEYDAIKCNLMQSKSCNCTLSKEKCDEFYKQINKKLDGFSEIKFYLCIVMLILLSCLIIQCILFLKEINFWSNCRKPKRQISIYIPMNTIIIKCYSNLY